MTTDLFVNNFFTTATAGIGISDTSIAVASLTGAPAANGAGNQWRLLCESEWMIVTNQSGLTLTVTRGAEGSTAVAHNSGVILQHVVTAGAIQALLQNPMSAVGDLIIGGAAGVMARLASGSSGLILTAKGAGVAEVWGAGPMTTLGDLMYFDGSLLQRIGIGTTNQQLKTIGGIPAWAAGDNIINGTTAGGPKLAIGSGGGLIITNGASPSTLNLNANVSATQMGNHATPSSGYLQFTTSGTVAANTRICSVAYSSPGSGTVPFITLTPVAGTAIYGCTGALSTPTSWFYTQGNTTNTFDVYANTALAAGTFGVIWMAIF